LRSQMRVASGLSDAQKIHSLRQRHGQTAPDQIEQRPLALLSQRP
jgi:hypothetical protein